MIRLFFIIVVIAFAAQPDCAFADTVDAQAKPYLILGGLLAGLGFSCLGILFLRRGIDRRKLAARSLQWPVTDGQIQSAAVKEEMRHDAEGARVKIYIPQARYSYAVAGHHHEGTVIRPGIEQFGYGSAAVAQAQIEAYKIGTSVPVHYDPDDPSIAMLQTSETGSISGRRHAVLLGRILWFGVCGLDGKFGGAIALPTMIRFN
jgi:hypothetical protein